MQQIKMEPLTACNKVVFEAEATQAQDVDEGEISPVKVSPDCPVL
jgi:hypothetical protein